MPASVLSGPCAFALEVKKSRFQCQAAPVDSAAAALAYRSRVADPAATHNCWAYRIGEQYRFSDDGEPGGTAGRPILAAIDGQGLDRTMAVVTRWFGGVKLGAGGLVRAYGGCAAECLRRAPKQPRVETCELWLRVGFADTGLAHQLMAGFDAHKLDEAFDSEGVRLRLRLPRQRRAALHEALRDATQGRARLQDIDRTDEA